MMYLYFYLYKFIYLHSAFRVVTGDFNVKENKFSIVPALGQHKFGTVQSFSQPQQWAVSVGPEPFSPFLLLWYPDSHKGKKEED